MAFQSLRSTNCNLADLVDEDSPAVKCMTVLFEVMVATVHNVGILRSPHTVQSPANTSHFRVSNSIAQELHGDCYTCLGVGDLSLKQTCKCDSLLWPRRELLIQITVFLLHVLAPLEYLHSTLHKLLY